MPLDPIVMTPIGVIHTPFKEVRDTPIQPLGGQGVRGSIVLDPAYAEGLADVDGFSHLTLVYCFDRIHAPALRVVPFMDTQERGIFATRAPKRPNRIGLSIVRRVIQRHAGEIWAESAPGQGAAFYFTLG